MWCPCPCTAPDQDLPPKIWYFNQFPKTFIRFASSINSQKHVRAPDYQVETKTCSRQRRHPVSSVLSKLAVERETVPIRGAWKVEKVPVKVRFHVSIKSIGKALTRMTGNLYPWKSTPWWCHQTGGLSSSCPGRPCSCSNRGTGSLHSPIQVLLPDLLSQWVLLLLLLLLFLLLLASSWW